MAFRSVRRVPVVVAIAVCAGALVMIAASQGGPASSQSEIRLPAGYRDWKLISVAHEAGGLNDIRAVLGNDAAVKAYREGKLPYPDGAIIARLAWNYVPSEENDKVFGHQQSFVAGAPTNVQLMVKDSKRYAATGGWGYAQFTHGKADRIVAKDCYSCHEPAKGQDFLFTHYAP
jgi:hypothetical protein